MLVKEDLWPAELLLWNDVVGTDVVERAQSEAGADRAVTLGDCRIRAKLIVQLATNRDGGPMRGNPMISIKNKAIVGKLDLEACRLQFPLFFEHCAIGDINLDQAEAPDIYVADCRVGSLSANQIRTGNIILRKTTITGRVALVDAHLRGVLNLRGATFTNRSGGKALDGHNIKVDGDLLACDFVALGEVNLTGARIGGYLELDRATLSNSDGPALRGDGLFVRQDMLSGRLTAHGEVRLSGADITGRLCLVGALIESANNDRGHALSAESLTVGRDMDCRCDNERSRPFRVHGQLRLPGADIHGRLDLGGTQITNPGGKAFFARGLNVHEDLKCNDGFRVDGETSLAGAKIGRQLNVEDGTFTDLVNLESATVHRLMDMRTTWPDHIILRDFQYHSFSDIDDEKSVRERLHWLKRNTNEDSPQHPPGKPNQPDNTEYSPEIYNKLAEAYRAGGHEDAARKVLIAKLRARSDARRHILTGRFRAPRYGTSLLLDKSLDWTIRYGYRPLNIVWWVLGMLVVGGVLFTVETKDFVARPGKPTPDFHGPLYALDLLLPVAGIGHRGSFLGTAPGLWWATAFILLGWFFGLILLAGLSGVFKRD